MSDLNTLIPPTVELTVGGETLAIKPLKVGQMPAFLRAISPVMQHFTRAEIDWLLLFGEHGDDMLSAIGIAVGKSRQWVDELSADEAILLAAKVIEVNADFFTRTVIPRLDGLFAQAKQLAPAPVPTSAQMSGSTPSNG